ncbi:gp28 [Burkholderia phage Bcep43]|uniref:Gp28 n=2 Tax=Naesvirus TaxID=2733115 RepID=Q6UKC3_9CAUD|nr:gp28 [Burkholderia phage Bcep781]NP_958133.2 gp28 [Burkholderia phage Bcep43]AAN38029.1 gp28 [Burkholderia phage Bcep781]AAR89319.2 gp28 [Burkholderia phage Bcep43]
MSQLDIDWSAAPEWANWAAQDADGTVQVFECRPIAYATREVWRDFTVDGRVERVSSESPTTAIWTATLTRRPPAFDKEQPAANFDPEGMLRAQIGHLLEDMTAEQLDALYAHVRQQLDAAKFDELNRQLDKPFGEVPREWQLKAFEAFLDGNPIEYRDAARATSWFAAHSPNWAPFLRYRVKPKQS